MIYYFLLIPLTSIEITITILIQIVFNISKRNRRPPNNIPKIILFIVFININLFILKRLMDIWLPVIVIQTLIVIAFSMFFFEFISVIGITGQIASGKSTLSYYIHDYYKFPIISFDDLNRQILEKDNILRQIENKFGADLFNIDPNTNKKVLNKKRLAEIIFKDKKKKSELEHITHPKIFLLFAQKLIEEKFIKMNKIVFVENAILIRFGILRGICKSIISVCVKNKSTLINRVMNRDHCSEQTAENILKNQASLQEFEDYSNYVIYNDSDIETFENNIKDTINKVILNRNIV